MHAGNQGLYNAQKQWVYEGHIKGVSGKQPNHDTPFCLKQHAPSDDVPSVQVPIDIQLLDICLYARLILPHCCKGFPSTSLHHPYLTFPHLTSP